MIHILKKDNGPFFEYVEKIDEVNIKLFRWYID